MAATKDQLTRERNGDAYGYSVKGITRIFAKTLVAVTATGLALPAGTIRRDKDLCFAFAFDAAPTFADIGKAVYAVDDVTVSLDSASSARLKAGTLDGIEGGIPWVRV